MQKQMNNIIGIIGGAGVAATNKLLTLIEEKLTQNGAYRDCHHPEMIIWQGTQVPSRSMYLEGRGESFIPGYINIAKNLKNCGANKIAMCCNTAHYAIDEIEKEAQVDFINVVEQCVVETKKYNINKIGLIASDGCLKGKVYEKYFEKHCQNIEIIYPNEEHQQLITKGICNIKNKHRFDDYTSVDNPQNIFKKVCEYLKNNNAEKIIIGCTDIRVGYYDEANIDSLEVLANTIIKEFGVRDE